MIAKKVKHKLLLFSALSLSVLTGFIFSEDDPPKGNQRAFYECSEPMDIDSKLIKRKAGEVYFQFNTKQLLTKEEVKVHDFGWLNESPENYFVSYLVNTTDKTLNAKRQDGSLIMIQEAMDEEGEWQPIEYWVYSGCGNSYFSPLALEPEKCIMVPIKKYTGSFKTKIRLKCNTGKNGLFYSQSFSASIDKAQFQREDDPVNGILYHGPANYLDE
ncbi:MAG: hypothetical protein MI810_04855 [Flavobacteriales bacterium]|nr:hypothetical protein [Flavobacteriales bacterium]